MEASSENEPSDGLSLAPLRALRPHVDQARLGRLLCPPYDVIDADLRARLLAEDADNAVAVILPRPDAGGYADAAQRLDAWVRDGLYQLDDTPSLFVYEMQDPAGGTTRGLMGAVELRAAEDGVILPHENTMAGPVADRLQLMTRTGADLEPIYLVYDGGGPASELVHDAAAQSPIAIAQTPDKIVHRLWAVTDRAQLDAVARDLGTRRALIADGHHRYATYRERQRIRREADGEGPWDRGLALLVDSSEYGPQVHAIHRVIVNLSLPDAVAQAKSVADVQATTASAQLALEQLDAAPGFAAVLTDGTETYLVSDPDGELARRARRRDEPAQLSALDVTVVHRGLVEDVWKLSDDVDTVHYAHTVEEAIHDAGASKGVAILLRATPVQAVTAVAAAGARMPRKSTLFTPKPASGLVMRRLDDQPA
jgi:uncharacterized protein (DUF1015 family)